MRSIVTLVAVLSFVSIARADELAAPSIPAGHLYTGLTIGLAQPFGSSLASQQSMGLGFALGLYMDYEAQSFLIAAELSGSGFSGDDSYSDPVMLALRAGPILGRGPIAPYVTLGLASMAFGAVGDDAASGSGLTAEVGLLMFRDHRWFRLTPFLQYNLPLSSSGTGVGAEHVTSLSWTVGGVRVQF